MELKGVRYNYNKLSMDERIIYNDIYKGMISKQSKVIIYGRKLNSNNYSKIVKAIKNDNPQLFYINYRECTVLITIISSIIKFSYTNEIEKIRLVEQCIKKNVYKVIDENIRDSQSEYEKVLALHDYLISNVSYDYEAVDRFEDIGVIENAHTIEGAFVHKKCICEGYSMAMLLLCTMVNIEAIFISGKANSFKARGAHAWNIVKVNGYYHHVDVTWDCQYYMGKALPIYFYFNISDRSIEKDHIWDRSEYPNCDKEPYSYFNFNSAILQNTNQISRFLSEKIINEEKYISFIINNTMVSKNINFNTINNLIVEISKQLKYSSCSIKNIKYYEERKIYSIELDYKER